MNPGSLGLEFNALPIEPPRFAMVLLDLCRVYCAGDGGDVGAGGRLSASSSSSSGSDSSSASSSSESSESESETG